MAGKSRARWADKKAVGSRVSLQGTLLWQRVHEVLRNAIVNGELESGERIVELDVARNLSVSQSTVREALKQLAHDGLVLQLPRRGSYVASVDEESARQAYQIRAALERVAAAEFCANAEEVVIRDLESDLADMRAAAAALDPVRFVESDIAFHRRIWGATGNPLLPRMWSLLEGSMRGLTVISNQVYFRDLAEVAETHVPLLDALRRRNVRSAPRLFADHAMEVWRQIDGLDGEVGEPPAKRTRGRVGRSARKSVRS